MTPLKPTGTLTQKPCINILFHPNKWDYRGMQFSGSSFTWFAYCWAWWYLDFHDFGIYNNTVCKNNRGGQYFTTLSSKPPLYNESYQKVFPNVLLCWYLLVSKLDILIALIHTVCSPWDCLKPLKKYYWPPIQNSYLLTTEVLRQKESI